MEELIKKLNGKTFTHKDDQGEYTITVNIPKDDMYDTMDLEVEVQYRSSTPHVPEDFFTNGIKPILDMIRTVDPDQVYINVPTINIKKGFVFFGSLYTMGTINLIDRIQDNVTINKIKSGFTEVEKLLAEPDYFTKLVGDKLPKMSSDFEDVYDTKKHVTAIVTTLISKLKVPSGETLKDSKAINYSIFIDLEHETGKVIKPKFKTTLNVFSFDSSLTHTQMNNLLMKIEDVIHRFGIEFGSTSLTPER
jgi:hypothetical protein